MIAQRRKLSRHRSIGAEHNVYLAVEKDADRESDFDAKAGTIAALMRWGRHTT
jgi:hypothetical protein